VTDSDCINCGNSRSWKRGKCYWHGCDLQATEIAYGDGIWHRGKYVATGDIELCWGHKERLERLGRLDLDWDVIYAAMVADEGANIDVPSR
jgi:hypothetical protein